MCILKVYSDNCSFKMFAETTDVPVYSVFDKGEYLNKKKTRKSDSNSISFDVSDKEWDKFAGQVIDTITFLNQFHVASYNNKDVHASVTYVKISGNLLEATYPLSYQTHDRIQRI